MHGRYDRRTQMKDESKIGAEVKLVYTCEEIQRILGISRSTAYRLIKTHVFHTVRIGGQYRISNKSIDTWLEKEECLYE